MKLTTVYYRLRELGEDLWYGPNRRYTLRAAPCRMGLHWPIRFHCDLWRGSYAPPEPGWACDFCGHERLPYRAPLWKHGLPW